MHDNTMDARRDPPSGDAAERPCAVFFYPDNEPPRLYVGSRQDMLGLYERCAVQWTGVMLCEVLIPDGQTGDFGAARRAYEALRASWSPSPAVPPRAPAEAAEVEQAIREMEFYRKTHVDWAEHFEKHPELAAQYIATGEWDDANEHRRVVGEYDRVIRLLRALATRLAAPGGERDDAARRVDALLNVVQNMVDAATLAHQAPTIGNLALLWEAAQRSRAIVHAARSAAVRGEEVDRG